MNQNVVTLDLRRTTLYVWEDKKPIRAIDYMLRAMEAGAEFPPVRVCEIPGGYELVIYREDPHDFYVDGGHKRAIAHLIAGVPLKCTVWKKSDKRYMRTNVRDVSLVSDAEAGVSEAYYASVRECWPSVDFIKGNAVLALPKGIPCLTVAEASQLVRAQGGLEARLTRQK